MTIFQRLTIGLTSLIATCLATGLPLRAENPDSHTTSYTVEATLDSLDRLIGQRYRFTRQKEKEIHNLKQKLKR